MTIAYQQDTAVFADIVGVEEAEGLLEWLQSRSAARIDLAGCEHLHPAHLQILLAAHASVVAWPADGRLRDWLQSAFRVPTLHSDS